MSQEQNGASLQNEIDLNLIRTIDELEREEILKAMKVLHGNKTKVAKAVGRSLKTIYSKLKEYDYSPEMLNTDCKSE